MVFDGVSKGAKDPVVEQMVEEATKVLETVVDELWLLWVERLIPNISHHLRVEVEAKAQEEQNCKHREEVKHLVDKKLARAVKRDKQLKEKLMEVLEGQLTQAELEIDSEAEEMGVAEESEVIRTMGGTQLSVMEVDEEE